MASAIRQLGRTVATEGAVKRKRKKPTTYVYGCGFGKTGSLFTKVLRETELKTWKKPQQIIYFNSRHIRHIAAGFGFSLMASRKHLYGGGVNIFSNNLSEHNFWNEGICLNSSSSDNNPLNELFNDGGIQSIAAGRRHFLVASAKSVYGFGDNSHGQCGQNPEKLPFIRFDQKFPLQKILIPFDNREIHQVHCTLDTSFIVLKTGEVLSFGLGTDGQLGRGICSYDWHCLPVDGDLKAVKINELKGSTDTLMARSENGELFMWGQNEYEQMSPFIKQIQCPYPREIRLPLKKIQSADSTATSCMILSDSGIIYVWGYGIIGLGPNITTVKHPVPLDSNLFSAGPNDNGEVKKIFAGNTSMFAITKTDNIFSWGFNRFSHLGLTTIEDQYFPFQINILKKPINVSVAPDHTLFLMQ